jgi:superfamily II DNA or RNA helicase
MLTRLAHNNVLCYVDGEAEILELVKDTLTWTVKGARYSPAYQKHQWDGKKSLFYPRYKAFPAGLLTYVSDKLKREKVEFEKTRIAPFQPDIVPEGYNLKVELRDYQDRAVQSFLKQKRGIIKLPPRSGKTIIAIAAAQSLNAPTLFMVDGKDLFHQTISEWINKTGYDPGMIGDGKWVPKKFTIGMIDTFTSKAKRDPQLLQDYLLTIRNLIVDEVHTVTPKYLNVGHHAKNADYRMGLSATPFMKDKGNKLMTLALTGPLMDSITMSELIEKDVIVRPKVFFIATNFDNGGFSWDEIYEAGIVNNIQRNLMVAIAAKKMVKAGEPVLILIEKLRHGENLLKLFEEAGLKARFVSGKHKRQERDLAKLHIQDGTLDVLITTRIFDMGIDLPAVACVIIASGYKSATKFYQQGTRGITKYQSKPYSIVVDFADYGHAMLAGHTEKRIEVCRKEEGFEVHFTDIDSFDPKSVLTDS